MVREVSERMRTSKQDHIVQLDLAPERAFLAEPGGLPPVSL